MKVLIETVQPHWERNKICRFIVYFIRTYNLNIAWNSLRKTVHLESGLTETSGSHSFVALRYSCVCSLLSRTVCVSLHVKSLVCCTARRVVARWLRTNSCLSRVRFVCVNGLAIHTLFVIFIQIKFSIIYQHTEGIHFGGKVNLLIGSCVTRKTYYFHFFFFFGFASTQEASARMCVGVCNIFGIEINFTRLFCYFYWSLVGWVTPHRTFNANKIK